MAQVKSTIDFRKIMDDGKIIIVNLSKGKIGEDNMKLLGGMLVTKIQMAAMERVDMPERVTGATFIFSSTSSRTSPTIRSRISCPKRANTG